VELLPADYIVGGLVIVTSVIGLFRGFSGTLAFFIGCAAAACTAAFGWTLSKTVTPTLWVRGAMTLVGTLMAFGIVRIIVKKLVNGLLSQPTDALLGALVGAVIGLTGLLGWAYSGRYLEYSNIATEAARYMASTGLVQVSSGE